MPSHIKIIHAHEFIKATAEGTLDFQETKKMLIDVATASEAGPMDNYEILLDTRKANSNMSISDLYGLVTELQKHRKIFSRKIAILSPLERFNYAEFFAISANNDGFQVNAFALFSDAMEWLILSPDLETKDKTKS